MSNKINMQRFAALPTQGTHTMHFFNTYKEARDYVVRTGGSWYVVKVLGRTRTQFIMDEAADLPLEKYDAVKCALTEFGVVINNIDPGQRASIDQAIEALP